MDNKTIIGIMSTIIGVLIFGWGSWVTVVSLNNNDKTEWMRKMQGQIDKNSEHRLLEEGRNLLPKRLFTDPE